MHKDELRQQIRQAKRQFSQQQLTELSLSVLDRLRSLLAAAQTVLLYYPLPDEVDVRPLISELAGQGRTVLLPRVTGDTTMELRRYSGEADLCQGAFGIMEPVGDVFTDYSQIDVAVVPAMAYDAQGHRLGRGRGYYDRFLAAVPHIYKIGVCFDFQKIDCVPVEATDVSVDWVA